MSIDLGNRRHQQIKSVDDVISPPGKRDSRFWTECILVMASSSQFSQKLSIKYLLYVGPLGFGRGKPVGLLVIVK